MRVEAVAPAGDPVRGDAAQELTDPGGASRAAPARAGGV